MGFYGNLYTNLTTFFHNIWFRGTAKTDESFLNDADILTNSITAQPVVAFDGVNINSGNRWIQFKSEADDVQNGVGGVNSAGITIYHAPPVGVDPKDVANKTVTITRLALDAEEAEEDKFANIGTSHANNLDAGGYLTTQTANYDKAGHLMSLEEKIFKFPDVKTVRETADTAKNNLDTLTLNFNTTKAIVDSHANILTQINGENGLIPQLTEKVDDIEDKADNALNTANGLSSQIQTATSTANQAKSQAETAAANASTAKLTVEGAVPRIGALEDVDTAHRGYFLAIKEALALIAQNVDVDGLEEKIELILGENQNQN